MKRKIALLIAVISVIVLLLLPAYAAGGTFRVEELGITVTIPPNYEGFTKELEGNSEFLDYHGFDRELLLQIVKESDIFFLALHEDMEDDIVITKTGATTVDLGSKSEEELSSFKDLLVEEMVNIGCEITSAEIYRDAEVIFIKTTFSFEEGGEKSYRQMYSAYCHGIQINIRLTSYLGFISAEQESSLKAFVDSISFTDAAASSPTEPEPDKSSVPAVSSPPEEAGSDRSFIPAVSSPPKEAAEQGFGSVALGLLIALVITVLPISIFRFIIKKSAADKKTAARIAVFYGIFAFIAAYAVTARVSTANIAVSASVVLWSALNFILLTIGKKTSVDTGAAGTFVPDTFAPEPQDYPRTDYSGISPAYESPTYEERQPEAFNDMKEDPPVASFCTNCGSKLRENSSFCSECGTAVVRK